MRRLIIRPGAIGDCILSLPALGHLRAAYTEVWVPSALVPLIQIADHVSSIASTGIDRIGLNEAEEIPTSLRYRLQKFDEIVSWYGANRPEFRDALESTNVPCLFHRALPGADSELHAVDYFCSQVGAPKAQIPKLVVPPAPKRCRIAIHPFSGSQRKNWPLQHYRELASLLPLPVDWIAGPEQVLVDAHRFENLFELATWLSGAALYIGNDSGITHLAAAVGIPVLAIFGPTSASIWGPRGIGADIIELDPTFDQLSVHHVCETARKLIG